MISDQELERILAEAAAAVSLPDGATEAIRAQATTPERASTSGRWESFRRRELALAGTSIAAVIALVVVLLTSSSPTVTPVPYAANPKAVELPANTRGAPVPSFSRAAGHAADRPATSGRAIIATGTLHLLLARPALNGAVDRLEALASSFGGYIGHSAVTETGRHPGGSLVLDVPAKSFGDLVSAAGRAGTVRSLSTSDADVTSQVVDLGARLTALVDERSQLEALLAKAGKISDLLAVENQIEFVQSQIEQIQSQQRVLDQQVAFSALTVEMTVTTAPVESSTGFAHAWHVALTGFVNGVKDLVAHLGDIFFTLLVVLIGLALIWLAWRRGWPVLRRRLI